MLSIFIILPVIVYICRSFKAKLGRIFQKFGFLGIGSRFYEFLWILPTKLADDLRQCSEKPKVYCPETDNLV